MSCTLFRYIPLFCIYLFVTACSSNDGGSDNVDTGSITVTGSSLTATATASAGGSISPGSATVTSGNTASFTLTTDVGYIIDTVTGCDGSLVGNTYTTGSITANCTVTANFSLEMTSFTVTPVASAGGSVSPGSATVTSGDTTSFTLTTDVSYMIDTVTGCGGSLVGNTYTTGSITANCTVIANFSLELTSFEIIDPTPGASNGFGASVVILSNGNIVVFDPGDFSVVGNGGAVHLYNPVTQTRITSMYYDNANDTVSLKITALDNNNFVISSPNDNVGGIMNAGSVRLFNGNTGAQIGATIAGDVDLDSLGSGYLGTGGITVIGNNNFVISSAYDDEGGINNAGSVRLIDGNTGTQIGATLAGDNAGDTLGSDGIVVLSNNNFVIASSEDDVGGVTDAGSVQLVDGNTGVQIGATLAGDVANDQLGSSGITALANNNFVISSFVDDEGGVTDAGSVRLVNGSTGVQIGSTLAGDKAFDVLSRSGVTALSNNNFVIASSFDDNGGIVNAGSVRLIDGNTGVQIGATLFGDLANDSLGSMGITALGNNNFVIASHEDDEGGITDAGSVRLVNGSTGVQIGAALAGNDALDLLGVTGITALGNNNYVIVSERDDVGGIVDAGSVRLVDGSTGVQIGTTLAGDVTNDVNSVTGITALGNNNFVIATENDDVDGIVDAGSVRLVNGNTGDQIGAALVGDVAGDRLGSSGVTALVNNNFVVASGQDNEGGITDAGSVIMVDGSTGAQIGAKITGSVSGDFASVSITPSATGLYYYILSTSSADNGGMVDSGFVSVMK